MLVKDVMSKEVITVGENENLAELIIMFVAMKAAVKIFFSMILGPVATHYSLIKAGDV